MEKTSTLKVAGTYIGTVVGAGFASGQELLQFFAVFGFKGLIGIFIVTIIFMLFGYFIMKLGMKLNSTSHMSVIRYLAGKDFGPVIDFFLTFFLFCSVTVMIAGAGAALNQQFNVPILIGNSLIALITAYTVMLGLKGIINSISFVVPFLILAAIIVSGLGLINRPFNVNIPMEPGTLMGNWFTSAILYGSYNIILSIAVLAPLGARVNNLKTLRKGAILGGLGLGLCSVSIFLTLYANIGILYSAEVPMILIAKSISPIVIIVYSVILLAEIYTTSVGSLYGFIARITPPAASKYKFKFYVSFFAFMSFLASLIGFSNMVKYLYPIVGYAGLFILVSMIFKVFCQLKIKRG